GRHRVHQESGAAAARRHRRGVLPARAGAGARRAVAVRRALLGGGDADPGRGRPEELRAQGAAAPAARRSEQSHGQLPRGKAQQCHARLAHRDGPDGPGGLPAVVARKWPEESLHDSGRACHASPSSQGLTMNGGPGFSEATQLRSGASGLLKTAFMRSGPQGVTRTNEPWAAPFIRTTVELEMPLFLMSSPLCALVEGSNTPTMISVRMALFTGCRTAAGAVRTGQ